MNWIGKKNICMLIVGIVLLSSFNPALGREGRGDSFMRAFGMTVSDDSFALSYQDWSHRLAGMTGETGSVGPVLAALGDGDGDGGGFGGNFRRSLQGPQGGLTALFSFGGSIVINQVSYTFLPYIYTYRGGTR